MYRHYLKPHDDCNSLKGAVFRLKKIYSSFNTYSSVFVLRGFYVLQYFNVQQIAYSTEIQRHVGKSGQGLDGKDLLLCVHILRINIHSKFYNLKYFTIEKITDLISILVSKYVLSLIRYNLFR